MKPFFVFLFFFVTGVLSHAQKINVSADPGLGFPVTQLISEGGNFKVNKDLTKLKHFSIKSDDLASGNTLVVAVAGANLLDNSAKSYTKKGEEVDFSFDDDIINKQVTVTEKDGSNKTLNTINFRFIQTASLGDPKGNGGGGGGNGDQVGPVPMSLIIAYLAENYEETRMGLRQRGANDNVIHIFLNEYGNNILSTIPQGISNCQYKVHILYQGFSTKPDDVDYSINQKTGSFSSSLLFNNTGILSKLSNFQDAIEKGYDCWHEKTFLLSTSTDDISFDVTATTKQDNKPVVVTLNSYTIKMSPVYHGTFDVGLINSNLNNPTFSLVQSPNSPDKVVKETNSRPTGIVTVMATFYTSPVLLFEKIIGKKTGKNVAAYKLTGRNFLDDHKFLERIYPTVGVSVSSKTFENLFFGLNWELARGLSVFGGGHWGKVNTFEMPNYKAGVTPVTQEEFDFYTNKKWKLDWAYGVQLDILIITNLFK